MCGLNSRNIDYVAKAISEVVLDDLDTNEIDVKRGKL